MVITRHKIHFTPNGRHAKTVAVIADALHYTGNEAFHARIVGPTEPQTVQRRNGPCPHRKNIAVDAAHACGSTLVGFDGAGVVVAFNFKHATESIANIDQPCIFLASPHQQAAA